MPGLTGIVAAPRRLAEMTDELVSTPWLDRRHLVTAPVSAGASVLQCLAIGREGRVGMARGGGCALVVEGWIDNVEATGDRLASWLLDRFLEVGEGFVESLDGSFQIVVHKSCGDRLQSVTVGDMADGTTWLYVDPIASRRLFYAADGDDLCFSPEVAPLMRLLGRSQLDPAQLMHFLISGRFFAGGSALHPVRQLLPGEVLVHGRDGWRRQRYFLYAVDDEAQTLESREALARLEPLLEEAVLRAWRRADQPAFLLSGGWDSRFIFYTVARAVADCRQLRTVIWGDHLERPHSDTWTSAAISRRFGTRHLVYSWGATALPERFERMLTAQSGMTDVAFTHVDELVHCDSLRADQGIESIFRGDEVFGPNGAEATSVDDALARLAMRWARQVLDADRWLLPGESWIERHDAHLDSLIAAAPAACADLRDTLYCRERLPALQHHLNYHKSHHVEMFNPLVDTELVRFWRRVPAADRFQKRIFKRAFERRFGDELAAIPIASASNSVDWPQVIANDEQLRDFLHREIAALPEPLDRAYFQQLLERPLAGADVGGAAAADNFRVPTERLIMRAVILGRWLRRWGSGAVASC